MSPTHFNPTEEELIGYLDDKNKGKDVDCINKVQTVEHEPEDLPGLSKMESTHTWHFFCHPEKLVENSETAGKNVKRMTKKGYWKKTGRQVEVKDSNGNPIGVKSYLVFTEKTSPSSPTQWVIHEFHSSLNRQNENLEVGESSSQAAVASAIQIADSTLVSDGDHENVSRPDQGYEPNPTGTQKEVYVLHKLFKRELKKEGQAGKKGRRDTIAFDSQEVSGPHKLMKSAGDGKERKTRRRQSHTLASDPQFKDEDQKPITSSVPSDILDVEKLDVPKESSTQIDIGFVDTTIIWKVGEPSSQAAVAYGIQSNHHQPQAIAGLMPISNGGCENISLVDQVYGQNPMDTPKIWEVGEPSNQPTVAYGIQNSHHQPQAIAGLTPISNGGFESGSLAGQMYGQNPMDTPKIWEVREPSSQATVAYGIQSSHHEPQAIAGLMPISNGGCESGSLAGQMYGQNPMDTPKVITSSALCGNGGFVFSDNVLAELSGDQKEDPTDITHFQGMRESGNRMGSDTVPGTSNPFSVGFEDDLSLWDFLDVFPQDTQSGGSNSCPDESQFPPNRP